MDTVKTSLWNICSLHVSWIAGDVIGTSGMQFFAWRVKLECFYALVRDCVNGVEMRFSPVIKESAFAKLYVCRLP